MAQSAGPTNEELLEILEDQYARDILVETVDAELSVEALADACNASEATIYRRIDRLEALDLIDAQQRLDPDGHHFKVYSARLERVSIVLSPEGFDIEIDRTGEDPADRFTRLYEEFSG